MSVSPLCLSRRARSPDGSTSGIGFRGRRSTCSYPSPRSQLPACNVETPWATGEYTLVTPRGTGHSSRFVGPIVVGAWRITGYDGHGSTGNSRNRIEP